MSGWNEQALLGLAPAPWQPLSARRKPPETTTIRLRAWILGGVTLLHILAFAILLPLLDRHRWFRDEETTLVDFIEEPPPMHVLPNETVTIRMPKPEEKPRSRERAPAASKPAVSTRVPPTATDIPMQVVETKRKPSKKLELFNPDGSMKLPDNMLDEIDKKYGDKRTFSWQIPHYEDADKYFKRNPALVYEETRFDQYWTPEGDILTSFLQKAVDATTKEVKMKVPGTNGSYVVCKISILAAGGACGVLTNGADWNGPQDDPNTLNAEEQRQCAAWWQKIVNAKTQDAWHATKKLYEKECRKPLLDPARG